MNGDLMATFLDARRLADLAARPLRSCAITEGTGQCRCGWTVPPALNDDQADRAERDHLWGDLSPRVRARAESGWRR